MKLSSRQGQSLVELIIAIGIGTLFIIGAIGALSVTLRLESQSNYGQPATELAADLIERLRTIANADWHNFDGLGHDGEHYQAATSSSFYVVTPGEETVILNGLEYRRYFMISNVARDNQDKIATDAPNIDPSTLKITAVTEWTQYGQTSNVSMTQYVARVRNRIWGQTNWVGGAGGDGPIFDSNNTQFTQETNVKYNVAGKVTINDLGANLESTAGNGIDAIYRYGWGDVTGWIDFAAYGNVTLGINATTTGYASSSIGYIALDCATSPGGDICPQSLFGVMQDGSGILSGFGWSDAAGWISFNCATANNCAAQGGVDYNASVDPVTGFLQGWAWSDTVGWISFNCDHSQPGDPLFISDPANSNTCPAGRGGVSAAADYAVKTGASTISTAVLDSMIFDTTSIPGVALNTLTWYGTQPLGTGVAIQIASGANLTDVETADFVGPDGTSNSYYRATGQGIPLKINRNESVHNNVRYIRYRIKLESDSLLLNSPEVQEFIINYSL